ncbi:MAG: DUF2147 domain-containing protein [Gammaproteobacteria bacterium]|nr:DUF2147 domain-containing protein [Gammaproteobacteria bacterium]
MKTWLALAVLFIASPALAADVTGRWNTIDDTTGEVRSTVELTISDGVLQGRIIELINPEEENPICDLCDGELKDQPVIGLQIIDGLTLDGDEWSDGTIVDPENGKSYRCKIWREGEKLLVRGYIGFFFRTQEWRLASD